MAEADSTSPPLDESPAPEAPGDHSAQTTTSPTNEAPVEPMPPRRSSDATVADAPPTFVFFGVVAALALILDVVSKAWAEVVLSGPDLPSGTIVLLEEHLTFTPAYNRGGAWGLLQDSSEHVRRPFFLIVSVAAVVFIFSLYSRLAPGQTALKWGLPLVLGGALGNLADRVVRSSVVDFIDYRADWITGMNELIAKLHDTWHVTSHWPTFNVADICICTGVGLMAVDMITSKRPPPAVEAPSGA